MIYSDDGSLPSLLVDSPFVKVAVRCCSVLCADLCSMKLVLCMLALLLERWPATPTYPRCWLAHC
jgi:hypothetical protein